MNAIPRRETSHAGRCSGCGSDGCECAPSVCHESPFCRPRFFAGQLLTEEDLDQLVEYVVGKNRLRNRYLFGSGVVCGLTVTCHPCGDGRVIVAPGYAIDCCGNDIHLPCPEEIDVNALARELRLRRLEGYDCGDPCEDGADEKNAPTRRYCLYVRYAETPKDPVTPYLDDEPCGNARCEPTRVCEGYRFELDCVDDDEAPVDVLDRLRACFGDLASVGRVFKTARVAQARAARLKTASEAARARRAASFTEADVNGVAASRDTLARFVEEEPREIDESELRRVVADYQVAASTVGRYRALPKRQRKQVLRDFDQLAIVEEELPGLVKSSGDRIREVAPATLPDPESREDALYTVEQGERFAAEELAPEAFANAEAQLFLHGAAFRSSQLHQLQLDVAGLKAWLLERLESSASLTSCKLAERLKAIRLDDDFATGLDGSQVERLSRSALRIALILLEYLRDCVCLALNPVCSDCKDPRVLLACLEVRDCEVVDICNMSRRFVLSPAAMRYWLPPLSSLGDLIERFCCEYEFGLPAEDPTYDDFYRRETQYIAHQPLRSPAFADADPRVTEAADALSVDTGRLESIGRAATELGMVAWGATTGRIRELSRRTARAVAETDGGTRTVVRERGAELERLREENRSLREGMEQLRERIEALED